MSGEGEGPSVHRERFQQYRALVAAQRCTLSHDDEWIFCDYVARGVQPRRAHPLVMLHGAAGTANGFFHQVLSLGGKGWRVIAAQWPDYETHIDWIAGFAAFLDGRANASRVHLFGEGLGGFLALLFARRYPRRVASLVLCNAFNSTSAHDFGLLERAIGDWLAPPLRMLGPHAYGLLPEFALRGALLETLPQGMMSGHLADSVDFMVDELERLHQPELASRLRLHTLPEEVGAVRVPAEHITLVSTLDSTLPSHLRAQLESSLPGAKVALMKGGADLPALAAADELTLHVEAHLERWARSDAGRRAAAGTDAPAPAPAPS